MSPPVRVLDSSPIIAFERIGSPEVLEQLLGSGMIPPAVREEVYGEDEPADSWMC